MDDMSIWDNIRLPKVKKGNFVNMEERKKKAKKASKKTAKAMGKMFKDFEEKTGYKVVIENGNSPIQSLFPKENKA